MAHAGCRGRDGGVGVQDAERERLEQDSLGEGGLDDEDGGAREEDFALGVSPDVAGESVVGQPIEGFGSEEVLLAEPVELGVGESELLDRFEEAAGACDHAVSSTAREPAGEEFEHAPPMRGARCEGRVDHGEFVAIGEESR